MTLLYDRRIRIEVAGLTIEGLRIAFDVERQSDATQNKGKATIYNLAPENEDRVYERADDVRIHAGYPETQALVFDGFSERVQRVREKLSRQTIIKLGDAVRKAGTTAPTLSGETSLSLRGPQPVADIVRAIARDIGLPTGPLDAIPAAATYTNWIYSGQAAAALSTVLKTVGCTWFEDNGVLRVNRPMQAGSGAMPQSDAPTISVSPDSGLLDRPTETDEGAEVTMLLNPAVVVGCRIELESKSLSGAWKVVRLRHNGDNWHTGTFTTWVDLRALQ